MAIVLVVEFQIKPAHIAEFENAITYNARQSVAKETGCQLFDVCRDPSDEAVFFLYEIYDDEVALQAHLESPHFLEMNAKTMDWVAAKTVRNLTLLPRSR